MPTLPLPTVLAQGMPNQRLCRRPPKNPFAPSAASSCLSKSSCASTSTSVATGYVPPEPLEWLTIARSVELERNHCRWFEQDKELKPGRYIQHVHLALTNCHDTICGNAASAVAVTSIWIYTATLFPFLNLADASVAGIKAAVVVQI